jgi:hypothetical protein
LLGSGNGERPKRMWPIGLEAILGTLGLKILLIEDRAAAARTLARRTPVRQSHQRFGNKSNAKPTLKIENVESPVIAAPQRADPQPVSHLRVIQSRNGHKFG